MTTGILTSEQAKRQVEDEVASIRQEALDFVRANPDVSLRAIADLLVHEKGHRLQVVSQAVTDLILAKQVMLTPEQRLRVAASGQ